MGVPFVPGTVDFLPVRVDASVMLPASVPIAAQMKAGLIELEIHGARL
jgi:hypothetical protein